MKEKTFLNQEECRQLFFKKEIFIFGTGVDAEQAQKQLSQYTVILAYVDNNRSGKERFFYGKRVLNLKETLKRRDRKQPIVVITYRFAMEICEQLKTLGLQSGIDFFVWDDMHLFHCDDNTRKYIDFLRDIWGPYKKENSDRKILVMFDNRHDLLSMIYAYCGNYFAQKYDAEIYAYFRFGAGYSNISKVMEKIYEAFNVKAIIDPGLNETQQKEADKICDDIWNGISTWEDWKNITVYGIHFGTTIIRDFLRVYIPCFDLKDARMYLFLKRSIETIVFWNHYIFENDISCRRRFMGWLYQRYCCYKRNTNICIGIQNGQDDFRFLRQSFLSIF